MAEKMRPKAEVHYSRGIDGQDDHDYVVFFCPKCGKRLREYGYPRSCEVCETVLDWGEHPPRIVKHLVWE